ncbi:ABC transporter substrate-binding protein [Tabrizicola sp.]|jgi:putative spermidine/putrescine transport system substrate-binding protein|uniref:ABC transporter substrate-binding protein n=1 Tax=Tabrizicola sp. TaxID=2005166 RepID=UPI0025E8F65A|nr:ABC transporter substrate-binding protein [Tabrizicola sp.]MBY0350244.1 ABC transporter substrate-binding protein [Tabrizicola sp.]
MLRSLAALFFLTTTAIADTSDGEALSKMTWDQIEAEAKGGTVNWFMWGGSDTINAYVSDYVAGRLKAEYGITLNRVPIADAAEIVNLILSEKEAGITDAGTVDLLWINGENFRSMKQGDLAYCGYTGLLPNDALVNWSNPAIANDFGVPVDGCEVPWNTVQFAFAYDSAVLPEPPGDMAALIDWIKANPGRFTYPAPPDFTGSAFLRHVFIYAAGGPQNLLGPFDQAKFDAVSARTWAILNEIEPFLWRKGATYPATVTQLNELFANGEVAFSFNYDPAQFGLAVQAGTWPETTRSYGLTDGTIGNTNYTLIPFNSPNKAAAMVVQNLLLSGEAQLEKAKTEVWGAAPAIEISRTAPAVQAGFAAIKTHPSVVPATKLAEAALPELQADWLTAIEKGWAENVGN